MFRTLVDRYRYAGVRGVSQAIARKVMPASTWHWVTDQPLEPILRRLKQQHVFSIVQIGAYIGDSGNDPLAKFLKQTLPTRAASVILVEPIKMYFDQLRKNYSDLPGVIFENVAVAETRGERTFYYLDADPVAFGHPEWLRQLSSLRADRMTSIWDSYEADKTLQEFYLAHRAQTTVQCVTLQDLLEKHKITKLDLLQIDAEGYDYEILKSIDFQRIKPRFINFEHTLLSSDERMACRAMLESAGYIVHKSYTADTLCELQLTKRHIAESSRVIQQ